MRFRQLLPLFGALFALYIIWGSTYFVIRIGVESWPPLMMAGVRFLSAGMLLMAFLLLRGEKLPPLRQTINAALIGLLLLAVGNGLVTVAEHQNVPSGIKRGELFKIDLHLIQDNQKRHNGELFKIKSAVV